MPRIVTPRPSPYSVCTDELRPYVEQYSGKFGPLEALRHHPELAQQILPTHYVHPGQSYEANGQYNNAIVRAGHPIDIRDMVGVLETQVVPDSSHRTINETIDRVREQAMQPDILSFARFSAGSDDLYHGNDIVIGVQPYVHGLRASVLEHPNRPADDPRYVISWFEDDPHPDQYGCGLSIRSALYDARGQLDTMLSDTLLSRQPNMTPEILIDTYRAAQRTEIMRPDRVAIMELVGDESAPEKRPYICQLRDFKERETADYRIDSRGFDTPKLVFGVTPESGEDITIVHSQNAADIPNFQGDSPAQSWGLLRTNHKTETPLSFQPENMRAYLAGFHYDSGKPSLAHSQERVAAMTDIAVFENMQKRLRSQCIGLNIPNDELWNPERDYDFSRHMIARLSGRTLQEIRCLSLNMGDAFARMEMEEILEETAGKSMRVRLYSDGYTAKMRALS